MGMIKAALLEMTGCKNHLKPIERKELNYVSQSIEATFSNCFTLSRLCIINRLRNF